MHARLMKKMHQESGQNVVGILLADHLVDHFF